MDVLFDEKTIVIFTDGSCRPNPGRGGWAYVGLIPGDPVFEIRDSGYHEHTTNNCMELTAVLKALETFETSKYLMIYSDSQYVIKCATKEWSRNKNVKMWERYDTLSTGKNIKFTWVRGHSGNLYNTLVDKMAVDEVLTHAS